MLLDSIQPRGFRIRVSAAWSESPPPPTNSIRHRPQHQLGPLSANLHKTMAPSDWASLPSDLVRSVADVFLASCDVDYYMNLRAVCRNWRAATDDPRGPDPRFSPRRWVLVQSLTGDDGRRCCLFLHVDTGRLLWKDVPMLRNYTCVASAEDGHLILEPASRNSRICLLNPITGRIVCFAVTSAQFLGENKFGLGQGRRMFATSSSPMVLYRLFDSSSGGCIDPTWDAVFNRESLFKTTPNRMFASMLPFKGRAYAVNNNGSVTVVEHNCRLDEKPELTTVVTGGFARMYGDCRAFLVDNAGEMLLVRLLSSEVLVFRVDVENGALLQIESIGNRAIFLGGQRCLSVHASNLPAIECNCIYYIGAGLHGGIYKHCLNDGSRMKFPQSFVRKVDVDADCPKSLARVLMEYACHDECDVGYIRPSPSITFFS